MPLKSIIAYVTDAAAFALPVGLLFLAVRLIWKKGKTDWLHEGKWTLFVTYLAALAKITAIRQATFADFSLSHSFDSLRLIPVWETIGLLEYGWWFFTYNVVGNLIWFVPLGFCLRWIFEKISWKRCMLIGGAVSFGIELFQWLLQSGISDVDDILLNALGTLMGWWICPRILNLWEHWRKKR